MKTRNVLCLLSLLALAAGGCVYQRPDVVSSPRPAWMNRKPADTAEKFFYVGEGTGESIVNLQGARAAALKDVCRQVADALAPVAVEQAIEIADQKGVAHGSAAQEETHYAQMVRTQVDQAATSLQQEGFYWERWAHKKGTFEARIHDYRYYMLASMPREMETKLTTELAHKIADDMAARAQKPATAAP